MKERTRQACTRQVVQVGDTKIIVSGRHGLEWTLCILGRTTSRVLMFPNRSAALIELSKLKRQYAY